VSFLRFPVVSIVLPVRNGAGTLVRAVESIRAQRLVDWELIVIDDGSVDGTAEILAAMAQAEPRIGVWRGKAEGIVAALNHGVALARGQFIARMDADDEAHRDRLAKQVEFLRAPINRDIGLVSCLVEFGGDRAVSTGYALHVDWINSLVSPEEIALNRFVESPVAHPSVMFRRELVACHGGYREGDFPEDYELWLRWMEAGVRMAKVPRPLLIWHDSPSRLSRTDGRYSPEAFFRMKAEWIVKKVGPIGGGRGFSSPSHLHGVKGRAEAAPYVYVWGAGRLTRKRAVALEAHGLKIAGYIDVDSKKTTPAIGGTGRPVISPVELPPPGEIFVLGYVTSRGAREFTREALRARGYVEGRDFLMCA
jgi:glycosyltransferase involved in cell wall biosynthesis